MAKKVNMTQLFKAIKQVQSVPKGGTKKGTKATGKAEPMEKGVRDMSKEYGYNGFVKTESIAAFTRERSKEVGAAKTVIGGNE